VGCGVRRASRGWWPEPASHHGQRNPFEPKPAESNIGDGGGGSGAGRGACDFQARRCGRDGTPGAYRFLVLAAMEECGEPATCELTDRPEETRHMTEQAGPILVS
jgi:hypothetical protein